MRNNADANACDRLAVALNKFINNRAGIPNPFQNKIPAAWLALVQAVDEERSKQRPNRWTSTRGKFTTIGSKQNCETTPTHSPREPPINCHSWV